ncbi:hypothetical protein NP233_g11438 [Leucocoprinus birnbaumii]|uniref:Serine/threonine-protein phosphatase 4 regulatory subunit 3-like central domain-containing protein n=1 Tax=Leucocoprinus birnbaumii TaxID=56174 RepID=A0AAD5YQZ1_9AGAR|nr:hypothetical protein NP233_g11438 [Leucocoprinus birnbaumii]
MSALSALDPASQSSLPDNPSSDDAQTTPAPSSPSTLPQSAPDPQLSADSPSTPHDHDQPQSITSQDAVLDPTTVLDPATQLTSSLDDQNKQPESLGMDQQQQSQEVKSEGAEPTLNGVNGTIELVEHAPGTISLEEAGNVVEETSEWIQEGDQMKRVKVRPLVPSLVSLAAHFEQVYELIGSRWVDQGTAFCFGQFQEETGEALLIARAERDFNDVILRAVIRSNDVYQRQQETLIVWTEPDGVDYALSFQDPEGCSEVWNFITEVQQHMNSLEDANGLSSSPLLGADGSITTASIIRSGHLPPPQLGIIGEIERAIKALARTQPVKERICEYIQQEEYIKSLTEVLNTAEDLESLENLHALCSLMQTILMLNDHGLYEHILEDDLFFGVVGMLEYDPDFPSHKANYREFLRQSTQFHQPIAIQDITIQRKIHHTYRLQFLKDVVLARALDDSTFNVLNSCIIFNQIDIISHIQQDQLFLKEIVRLFVDEEVLTGGAQRYQLQLQMMQQQQVMQHMQQRLHGPVVISLPPADQDDNHNTESGGPMNGEGIHVKKQDDNMEVDSVPKPSPSPVIGPSPLVTQQPPPSSMMATLTPLSTNTPRLPLNGALVVNGRGTPHITPNPRAGAYSFAPPENLTEAEINQRREVVLLIQQLCIMGKNVQLPARMALFRILVDRGILFAVQWAMNLPESTEANKQMISAGGEVLSALLDHDLNGVRGHVLKQIVAIEKERAAGKRGADKAETLLEMVCRIMARSRDLAVQSLVGDALKAWMDTPLGDLPGSVGEAAHAVAAPKLPAKRDDTGTERFLEYFYKDCVHILFKPLLELSEWKNCKDDVLALTREQSNRYVYLCDLLYNTILQHHFRSSFYILSSNNILSRVATLLRAKDKHLRHDLTLQESRRDNLLSCSCQEYFESMRRDNMKDLIKFCMTRHEADIRKLAETPLGGQRFELLIRRYEMNNEPPPKETEPEKPIDTRLRPGQNRFLEAEEEDYFNADDDEEDTILPSISQQSRGAALSPVPGIMSNVNIPAGVLSPGRMLNANPNINSLKRKRRGEVTGGRGHRPPLRSPAMKPLVDYGEDEDEDGSAYPDAANKMQQDAGTPGPSSSPKLAPSPIASTAGLSFGGPPARRVLKKIEEEDEDAVLESLVRGRTPAPSGSRTGPERPESPVPRLLSPPTRLGEKRRRGEGDDDDDELLSRLTKNKKQQVTTSLSQQQQQQREQDNGSGVGPMAVDSASSRPKNGDDPPKKIKVKIGGFGSALAGAVAQALGGTTTTTGSESAPASAPIVSSPSPAHSPAPSVSPSPSPAPPDSGTKDGDTG